MATLLTTRAWLLIIVLCFLGYDIVYAIPAPTENEPEIVVNDITSANQVAKARQTVRDAITLARSAAMFWPCDAATDPVSQNIDHEVVPSFFGT